MANYPTNLADAAYALAIEIHEGKWEHIHELHVKPVPASSAIVEELSRRCPGYTREQYQRALADGLLGSR